MDYKTYIVIDTASSMVYVQSSQREPAIKREIFGGYLLGDDYAEDHGAVAFDKNGTVLRHACGAGSKRHMVSQVLDSSSMTATQKHFLFLTYRTIFGRDLDLNETVRFMADVGGSQNREQHPVRSGRVASLP